MKNSLIAAILISLLTAINACATLPKSENVYFSILAGGGGTRLWPLSRDHLPKQFLELGGSNLIEQSISRLESYPRFEKTGLILATADNLKTPMHALVKKLKLKNDVSIIADPSRRDTGPAILLNVLEALKKNPDATIVFMPADPYIPVSQYKDYVASLEIAIAHVEANTNKIVLLGKTPTFPATGFGYIETGAQSTNNVLTVSSFKEKPDLKMAEEFLAKKTYLWNMGIFVGKAQFFAKLFEKYSPAIYGPVSKYVKSRDLADYNQAAQTSVDIAIMQPASKDQHLLVVPVAFDWQDVGDIKTFMDIQNPYLKSKGLETQVYQHAGAQNNQVFTTEKSRSNSLYVFVDVDGVCVVDTPDAKLVTRCDQAQKVKNVVEALKNDPALKHFVE